MDKDFHNPGSFKHRHNGSVSVTVVVFIFIVSGLLLVVGVILTLTILAGISTGTTVSNLTDGIRQYPGKYIDCGESDE